MAIMKLQPRMNTFRIFMADNSKALAGEYIDVTDLFGPFINSIRIRDGISEGASLVKRDYRSRAYEIAAHQKKKKETSPSELDMQVTANSYLEDGIRPGVMIKIEFGDNYGSYTPVFLGEIRSYPYGGAKDMVNFNVRAYGRDISLSNQEKNRVFQAKPLTRDALLREMLTNSGFELENSSKDQAILVKPGEVIQKGKTNMELMDQLAKKWNNHWYLYDYKTVIWADGADIYKVGNDKRTLKFGNNTPYELNYRTNLLTSGLSGQCNVESVDWSQSVSPGGSDTEPTMFTYTEDGVEYKSYKLIHEGITYRLRDIYRDELATKGKLGFGAHAADAGALTISGDGDFALHKYFEPMPNSDQKNANNNIPNSGDQSGIELTIMLNEGDVLLKAPCLGKLTCGGDTDIPLNTNLPKWLFDYSSSNTSMLLNIKETVLTFENGILKSELKCTVRTDS